MKPAIPREVNSILSAINRSKGQAIMIDTDGSVYTIVEKITNVSTKISMGKDRKNLKFTQPIKSKERGEKLGNIYTFLEDLPLPTTDVFEKIVSRKRGFNQFGNPAGKKQEIGSTNFLRNVQVPLWQDAVNMHPETEVAQLPTQFGHYIIFYFKEEDVIVLTNRDYEVREIITKEGVEVMNLNGEVIELAKKKVVDYYKLRDGSKVKVKTTIIKK